MIPLHHSKHSSALERERDENHNSQGWEQLNGELKRFLSVAVIPKYAIRLTLAVRRVTARTKCAMKIIRKYFVASLRIVPSRPGTPNCWSVHLLARCSITKKATRSYKNGTRITTLKRDRFQNTLPYAIEITV